MMDLVPSVLFFVVITGISTYLMAMAYKNTKFLLKHKVALKREEAVTREMTKLLAEDKKMSRKEKDERWFKFLECLFNCDFNLLFVVCSNRILWKKNEVADYEATTFSIFYNNALFLAIVILASFYVLRSASPVLNYILSVSGSAGLLALLSTTKPT